MTVVTDDYCQVMTQIDDVPLLPGFEHGRDEKLLAGHFDEWTRLQSLYRAFRSDVPEEYGLDYTLWYLLHYDDALPALQDWQTFSSQSVAHITTGPRQKMIPEELDPPEHTKYRQLLSGPLSPGNVAKMEDHIRARIRSIAEGIADKGKVDFVAEVSRQYPTSIFMDFIGMPMEHLDDLISLAHQVQHTPALAEGAAEKRVAGTMGILNYFNEALQEKRKNPKEDLLTKLTQANIDGQPLSDADLNAMGFLLYLAGLDTVANVLSYSFMHLAKNPDLRHDLITHPEKWPMAVEEFLRFYTLPTTVRVVTKDVNYAGCPMKAGDRIVVPLVPINRDPDQFENADKFIPDREHNRHLAFGGGPHRCVGSHLARVELRVAMEEWHKIIPDYSIEEGVIIREHVGSVAGIENLPLVW